MKRRKNASISKIKRHKKNDTYLPEEIVIDILLRLPVESIVRCKSVCKRWKNFIQSPDFIKTHYNNPHNPTRLLSVSRCDKYYTVALFTDKSLSHRENIRHNVLNNRNRDIRVILGPVNGLYYISYSCGFRDPSGRLIHALWNPFTSEFRHLPRLTNFRRIRHIDYLGFGSAGEDRDIKVVIINVYLNRGEFQEVKVKLYSLNEDSWKVLRYDSVCFPFNIAEADSRCNYNEFTHLNGVYYWLARTRNYDQDILFLFDMKSEEFRRVNLPTLSRDMDVESICLRDNNSIVLFVNENSDGNARLVHLWEMKKEGQWFKLLSIDRLSIYGSSDILTRRFWEKDEILITKKNKKVVLFNMNSHKIRYLKIHRSYATFLLDYKYSLQYERGFGQTLTTLMMRASRL